MVIWLSLFIASPMSWAWGNFGHQVVGELAGRHLCGSARAAVDLLLEGESMGQASTWADSIRHDPTYVGVKPWHYISLPFDVEFSLAPRSPRGDVVSAIHQQILFLSSSVYPKRAEALRLVLHFVADAHQPFHAGAREDGGGNGVQLTWYDWPTNLHSVWDTRMLKNLELSVAELSDELDDLALPPVTLLTPEDWVIESSRLAERAYPSQSELGYAYFSEHAGVAKQRLRSAAFRLAETLNLAFGCRTP